MNEVERYNWAETPDEWFVWSTHHDNVFIVDRKEWVNPQVELQSFWSSPQQAGSEYMRLYRERNEPLTLNRLMSLVYMTYGVYALYTGEPLYLTRVEAFKGQVVFPEIYHELKQYNDEDISNKKLTVHEWENYTLYGNIITERKFLIMDIIKGVMDITSDKTDKQINSLLRHGQSPIKMNVNHGHVFYQIPFEETVKYFKWLSDKFKEDTAELDNTTASKLEYLREACDGR